MTVHLQSHHRWQFPQHHAHINLGLPVVTTNEGPTLVQRSSETTSACKAGDNSGFCQKPTTAGNSETITIAVAAAIPTAVAILVLFLLHRRVKRKHRQEDRDDKYKSLDFGMDSVPMKAGGPGRPYKAVPEMSVTDVEKSTHNMVHGRGLSLDVINPYLLPAAVNSSTPSLHSLSRSIPDSNDPYSPVAMIRTNSNDPRNPNLRPGNASTYTRESDNDGASAGLIRNASRMSRSNPFEAESPDSDVSIEYPAPARQRNPPPPRQPNVSLAPKPPGPAPQSFAATAIPRKAPAPPTLVMPAPEPFHVTPPSPPRHDNLPAPPAHVIPASPPAHEQYPAADPVRYSVAQRGLETAPADNRRLSVMGLRPLPPDDPTDNPEQRANRIRSFYKEYFDDSKPNPAGHYQNEYEADIYADYADYSDYLHEQPPAPFAEPMGRRAMTPPPRVGGGGTRVRSNTSFGSTGHIGNPAFRRGPPQPKKQLPPPMALTNLPTPHRMTDDMAFTPINFAPPMSFRDRQAGRRPESPSVPYSPSVRAFTPLAGSFDDLNVLPSAHMLRKSATFTGLDFAPPPRFRNEGIASDAGSIRSNRSGISNTQQNAIRAGAYRVSRLPADMVGTQDDLTAALKPNWGMRP